MDHRLKVIVVEPDRAACLLASARAGELVAIAPTEPTIMAMLECYKPSLIAWRILEKLADAFMTVTEEQAREAMRRLAGRKGEPIVAGESGAASLLTAAADEKMRAAVGLGLDSRVLLINTETATDPASYRNIVGRLPATTE